MTSRTARHRGSLAWTPGWPGYVRRPRIAWHSFTRWVASLMPKGLYARSLLIVIVPMVILQSAVAYFFFDRHWQQVTYRLSADVVQEIATIIDVHAKFPGDANAAAIEQIAAHRLGLDVEFRPHESLPAPLPKPFFSLLDDALSQEISSQIAQPFWIDTVGRSSTIEIRIQLGDGIMRIIAHRNAAYATNSHIFIVWMVGTSLILIGVAIAFLRNQIRPILRLAGAAEALGKGRDSDFRPHGAREIRRAGYAFLEMKRRIERAIDQRTTMLNGVSHDLRTILTRFKLSIALMEEGPETKAVQKDIEEMQRMLEAYLAFARGDHFDEAAAATDMSALLEELKLDSERHGHTTEIKVTGDSHVTIRPDAFRRCLANLVANAQRFGDRIHIEAFREQRFLTINVDDDGPGIPADRREIVFKPFFRLDQSRNQDEGGTGLGLAIARDIARSHGGDIQLASSPMGGLRAIVRVPV